MWARASGNPHYFYACSTQIVRHMGVVVLVGRAADF